ncbi:MAG: hypothetical protein ACYS47_17555 [Planctomycetota bacterium]
MKNQAILVTVLSIFSVLLAGCVAPEKSEPAQASGQTSVDFTGTWETDGAGAEGVRTMVQEGDRMTGHFDGGRGRYEGAVSGRMLKGRFWWNKDTAANLPFEKTPADQRGTFEVTLADDGETFFGRTRFETGEWTSWNGFRSEEK